MARPRSDIAPRILAAARERFLAEGVDGASLRRIAQDAGTSIGMIYYYFPTKDDLFLAVLEEIYPKLLDDLASALAPGAPFDERLKRVSERVGSLSDDEFTVLRIVVREALVSTERRAKLLERFNRGHIALLVGAVIEGMGNGELTDRQPAPVLAVTMFASAVVPQILRRVVADRDRAFLMLLPDAETLAKGVADLVLRGVAAGARPERRERRKKSE